VQSCTRYIFKPFLNTSKMFVHNCLRLVDLEIGRNGGLRNKPGLARFPILAKAIFG
jgi:hypothetical protein